MFKHQIKGILGNMLLNTFAAAVPGLILQMIVLPFLARTLGATHYGLLITLLSVLNLIPATLGNSLNNIKLLYRKKYEDEHVKGDFQIILLTECIVSIVFVVLFACFYTRNFPDFSFVNYLLLAVFAVLWILREYYIVAFMLDIRYDCILINNIIMGAGFLLGIGLYHISGLWELVYILGYASSLGYIFLKTDLWKERLTKTHLFKYICKENIIYVLACLLYRVTSYADKMLLFPIIGGALLSVYHTATLSGKIISMVITPVSGVMLAYLSKMNNSRGERSFHQILKIGSVVCLAVYFVCLLVSRPILGLLYPQFVEKAMLYIPVTTATVITGVMISLLNPFVLRYLSMTWQFVINIINVTAYIALAFVMMHFWGLWGFCMGCMIASFLKLLTIIVIYYKGIHRT